mmetsp:Transcript_14890/g.27524  ORF Transcript_14890/g.27524 Transcript_14890/m.27524 type:complete len:106 (-) Transcript_14890:208-525(-)
MVHGPSNFLTLLVRRPASGTAYIEKSMSHNVLLTGKLQELSRLDVKELSFTGQLLMLIVEVDNFAWDSRDPSSVLNESLETALIMHVSSNPKSCSFNSSFNSFSL